MSTRYRMRYTHDIDRHPTWGRDYKTIIEIIDTQNGNIVEITEGYSKQDSDSATRKARSAASVWIAEREKQDAEQLVTTSKGGADGE